MAEALALVGPERLDRPARHAPGSSVGPGSAGSAAGRRDRSECCGWHTVEFTKVADRWTAVQGVGKIRVNLFPGSLG